MKSEMYFKNLELMFELFAESKQIAFKSFFTLLISVAGVTFISLAKIEWILIVILIFNFIAYIGLKNMLLYMCNPDQIKDYITKRKYNDTEIKSTYYEMNRSSFIKHMTTLSHVAESVIIVLIGDMLIIGMLWGLMRAINENMITHYNNQMKSLWYELVEHKQSD